MKVNYIVVGISILVILFGTIFITDALGLWQTSGRTFSNHSEESEASYETREEGSDYEETEHSSTSMLINGKTTFADLIDQGYTLEQLQAVLPSDILSTNEIVKEYSIRIGIEFSEIKAMIQSIQL